MAFIERHQLHTDSQSAAAREILARVDSAEVQAVRVVFVDQHGLLRGKTVMAGEMHAVLKDGLTIVSTLLSKDTSGTTVYSAFSADGGLGIAEMAGAGDIVMVPDPLTFQVLEWAGKTGWLLCDLRFTNGRPVPLCSRGVMRRVVERAAAMGYTLLIGVELELHLFRANGVSAGRPADDFGFESLNEGHQLLCEDRIDALEPIVTVFAQHLRRLGLPLRTFEIEYGPSQLEVTLNPETGLRAGDSVVLLRSALKQIARRHGYHATFMCRPKIPRVFSSGWHLHQSLLRMGDSGPENAFVPDESEAVISGIGRQYIAGLLRHARAASLFAVPTVNGYKRFQPYSMAPDRVAWARDNRAAMLRVTGSADGGSTHVENRIGEPCANPYLYMASQLTAGLEGIEHGWEPGAATEQPYESQAPRLPVTLDEAVRALAEDTDFVEAFGKQFVDYYIGIKRHEFARFEAAVTDWEQREYFELF
ncbi:glutamine synthetase family protein [Streptomyces sp. NPDC055722]